MIPIDIVKHVLCNQASFVGMNYVGAIFAAYKWEKIYAFCHSSYYFCLWGLPLFYCLIEASGVVKKSRRIEAKLKEQKEEAAKKDN